MATPDELRASLAESRAAFRAALEAVTDGWETAPASGEGEEAWSARKVAEHTIRAELFFTTAICDACGYPGVDVPADMQFSTPAEAIAAFDTAVETTNKKLKYVSDTDLVKEHARMGSSENILNIGIGHLRDHAQQIRTAAGV